jgi:hypothetical protein
MPGQTPFAPPALEAAWRKVQTAGQFLQAEAGSVHNLFDDPLPEALAYGGSQIGLSA